MKMPPVVGYGYFLESPIGRNSAWDLNRILMGTSRILTQDPNKILLKIL